MQSAVPAPAVMGMSSCTHISSHRFTLQPVESGFDLDIRFLIFCLARKGLTPEGGFPESLAFWFSLVSRRPIRASSA